MGVLSDHAHVSVAVVMDLPDGFPGSVSTELNSSSGCNRPPRPLRTKGPTRLSPARRRHDTPTRSLHLWSPLTDMNGVGERAVVWSTRIGRWDVCDDAHVWREETRARGSCQSADKQRVHPRARRRRHPRGRAVFGYRVEGRDDALEVVDTPVLGIRTRVHPDTSTEKRWSIPE